MVEDQVGDPYLEELAMYHESYFVFTVRMLWCGGVRLKIHNKMEGFSRVSREILLISLYTEAVIAKQNSMLSNLFVFIKSKMDLPK